MVDITPESNIFGIFRNLNYKSWFALAEFVDNSIASWEKWNESETGLRKPEKVRVQITIESSGPNPYIEIIDNSTGIKLADFPRAFKVASMPEDVSSLNEFGMGMKTAGFWFANNWSVRTTFAGDPIERTMIFNLGKILTEQARAIEPLEVPAPRDAHYTTVRLTDLNQLPKGRNKGKVRDHLTSIYRQFIRDGVLELFLDGEPLVYEEVEILTAPKYGSGVPDVLTWKKDIDLTLPQGGHVKGFMALRKKGNTALAGLALLRKRRLIEGSDDETLRPQEIFGNSNSFEYQRLFGELTLTGFKVTHTKDAIKWEEGQKESFLELLLASIKAEPLNLIQQAQKFRKREEAPPRAVVEDAIAAVSETLAVRLEQAIERIQEESADLTQPIPDFINTPVAEFVEREIQLNSPDHGVWKVKITCFSDPAVTDFFRISALEAAGVEANRISVQVNLAHPFATQYLGPSQGNLELLVAYTSSLAVALSLGKRAGAKSAYIIQYLNEILRVGETN